MSVNMEQLRNLSSQASERLSVSDGERTAKVETPSETPAASTSEALSSEPVEPKTAETPPKETKEAGTKETETKTLAPVIGAGAAKAPEKSPSPGNAAAEAIATGAEPASTEWKPKLKYKVDRIEKDIPEFLHSAIKDADSEEKVRQLLQRGEGIEEVKTRYQETKQFAQEIHQKHTLLNQGLSEMGGYIKKKDFGKFFDTLQVRREDVYQWVLQEAQFQQLPEERKREILRARESEETVEQVNQHNSSVEQQLVEQANKTRTLELRLVTSQPEVSSFATQFDSKFGKPGSFQDEVVRVGKMAWDDEGIDLPPEQAVKRVMDHYGRFLGQPELAAPGSQEPTTTAPGTAPVVAASAKVPSAAKTQPPVIPNLQGGSSSPTKAPVRNLADLNKLSHEASARIAGRQP